MQSIGPVLLVAFCDGSVRALGGFPQFPYLVLSV